MFPKAFFTGIMNLSAQDRAHVSLTGGVLTIRSAANNNITRAAGTTGGVLCWDHSGFGLRLEMALSSIPAMPTSLRQ
jgi:hypothetical protein